MKSGPFSHLIINLTIHSVNNAIMRVFVDKVFVAASVISARISFYTDEHKLKVIAAGRLQTGCQCL